jgi:hypothetical protein
MRVKKTVFLKLAACTLSAITLLLFGSCGKESDQITDAGTIHIISLTASDTLLKAWMDTADVIVIASGKALEYEWSCNHGTIHGSGDTIRYMAGECCVGLNTISCRVFNDSSSVSRDIDIRVTSYFEK